MLSVLLSLLGGCAVETTPDGDTAVPSQEGEYAGPEMEVSAKAAGCKASPSSANCDGKNPSTEGCDATATSYGNTSFVVNGVTVTYEVRYSTACKTNWARAKISKTSATTVVYAQVQNGVPNSDACYSMNGTLVKDAAGFYDCYYEASATNPAANTYYYTSMYYCPTGACVARAGGKGKYGGVTGGYNYTGWW